MSRHIFYRGVGWARTTAITAAFLALFSGCNRPSATTFSPATGSSCAAGCEPWQACVDGQCACQPRCSDDTACLDDECGGTCPCPPGRVQSATGTFVAPEDCHDSCASAAWACGELCGSSCGSCDSGTSCKLGRCECVPHCDGTRCEDGCGGYCPCADGTVCNAKSECVDPSRCHDSCKNQKLACGEMCGESCGTCGADQSCVQGSCQDAVSCANCPLSMRVIDKKLVAGKLSEVTLAVDFSPTDNDPKPRLADFRVRASRPAVVRSTRDGDALLNSHKDLLRFEPWDETWRRRADGAYQFVVYEATNTELLGSGRVVEITLSLDEWGPVKFALQRREQTFAPADADSALQASSYDNEVIVTR